MGIIGNTQLGFPTEARTKHFEFFGEGIIDRSVEVRCSGAYYVLYRGQK